MAFGRPAKLSGMRDCQASEADMASQRAWQTIVASRPAGMAGQRGWRTSESGKLAWLKGQQARMAGGLAGLAGKAGLAGQNYL